MAQALLRRRLYQWRNNVQQQEGFTETWKVLQCKTIELIAQCQPRDERALLAIHGIGKIKLLKYGKELLELVKTTCPTPTPTHPVAAAEHLAQPAPAPATPKPIKRRAKAQASPAVAVAIIPAPAPRKEDAERFWCVADINTLLRLSREGASLQAMAAAMERPEAEVKNKLLCAALPLPPSAAPEQQAAQSSPAEQQQAKRSAVDAGLEQPVTPAKKEPRLG